MKLVALWLCFGAGIALEDGLLWRTDDAVAYLNGTIQLWVQLQLASGETTYLSLESESEITAESSAKQFCHSDIAALIPGLEQDDCASNLAERFFAEHYYARQARCVVNAASRTGVGRSEWRPSEPTIAQLDAMQRLLRTFASAETRDYTAQSQLHLATLEPAIALAGRSVIEVGAGIAQHTPWLLDHGCAVLSTDGRASNVAFMQRWMDAGCARRQRVAEHESSRGSFASGILDLESPPPRFHVAEVIYAYGVLYHLADPASALKWMARHASEMVLLSTCVALDPGHDETLHALDEKKLVGEAASVANQALSHGTRPTLAWLLRTLKLNFEYVYMPATPPRHREYVQDWEGVAAVGGRGDTEQSSCTVRRTDGVVFPPHGAARGVFVASHVALDEGDLLKRV